MALTRRSFIASSAAFAAAGCASLGEAGGAADAPRLEFGKDGAFTFLQLTDLHLKPNGRVLHPRVERVLRAAFARYAPSLLVLTGDNVNGQEGDVNARGKFEETVDPLLDLFRAAGIPFCVTFGNHDSERKGPDRFSRREQYDYYRSRGGDLFVDHDVPDLHGVGSGVVSLFERGARRPSFNLFVMDSGDYPEKIGPEWPGYDGCRSDQIAWYERVSGKTPCLWFQHIIVPDVNVHGIFVDAPPCADPKAKEGPETGYRMDWPDGARRMLLAKGAAGVLKEHTCPPYWKTYRDAAHTFEGRTLYDSWRRMGNLRGAYFGHDHMNTFDGTDANGIRLGMTKCCTFWSYNDNDPGVRVFTVRPDGTYATSIFAESDC